MDDARKRQIQAILDQHRLMTVATLRPDGWPQATTVTYVNDGLDLYFLCSPDSQKARNLARDDRVSLTIDHDTADLTAITGLSMAARARPVTDREKVKSIIAMMPGKYPEYTSWPVPMPQPEDVRVFHVTPEVISLLDYSEGFGHTDLVKP